MGNRSINGDEPRRGEVRWAGLGSSEARRGGLGGERKQLRHYTGIIPVWQLEQSYR